MYLIELKSLNEFTIFTSNAIHQNIDVNRKVVRAADNKIASTSNANYYVCVFYASKNIAAVDVVMDHVFSSLW